MYGLDWYDPVSYTHLDVYKRQETNYWDWRADHFVVSPNKVYCGGVDGWGGLGVPQWLSLIHISSDSLWQCIAQLNLLDLEI